MNKEEEILRYLNSLSKAEFNYWKGAVEALLIAEE